MIYNIKDEELIEYVKNHPDCTRKNISDHLYKPQYGKRGLFTSRVSSHIKKLVGQKKLIEKNIVRKNKRLLSSNLTISVDDEKIATELQSIATELQNSHKLSVASERAIFTILDTPKGISEIGRKMCISHQTVHKILLRLEEKNIVKQDMETKKWGLTKIGEKMREEELIKEKENLTDDNLCLHIPFLVKPDEEVSIGRIAKRANGFYGHYFKQGISNTISDEDFILRIKKHLSKPSISQFIKPLRFDIVKVDCSEEKLLLWRLESLIKTVLYKSNGKKLGMGITLYDKLMKLLREEFSYIGEMIKDLSEEKQYVIWLMLNGVQLETILPHYEIVNQENEDFKDIIKDKGFPLKTYFSGRANETTLMEEDIR